MSFEGLKKIDEVKEIDDDTFNNDNTKLNIDEFKPVLEVVRDDEKENTEEKIKEIKEKIIVETREGVSDIPYKELDYKSLTKKQKEAVFNSPIDKEKEATKEENIKEKNIFSIIKNFYKKLENYVKNKRDKNYYKKGEEYLEGRNDGGNMKQEVEELMKTDPVKAKKWIIALGKEWKSFKFNKETKEFENTTKYSGPKETHW